MIADSSTLKIILIESQLLFARALSQVLSIDPAITVLATLRSLDDLPAKSLDRPDLVLVDVDEYSTDVTAALTACRQRFGDSSLCALSSFARPELMHRCLAADADGFIVKDGSVGELISAIKLLASGSPYVDARVAGGVLRRNAMNKERPSNDLSTREAEIVRLIAQGLSNRAIGSELALSEKTVKNHVSRIFDKLDIPARTGVAVFAIRSGLA